MAYDPKGRSTLLTTSFTVLTKLQVITNGLGTVSGTYGGEYLKTATPYQITATPKAGQTFVYWTETASQIFTSPTFSYTMSPNLTLTAGTFVSNNVAGKAAFTFPKASAQVTNQNFNLTGTLSPLIAPAQINGWIISNNIFLAANN